MGHFRSYLSLPEGIDGIDDGFIMFYLRAMVKLVGFNH